ncbi:MAG: hypothetical protein D6798_19125 [Deltaproteobacteria bacterium]|nr:MAG: hypothetical protein D6798_19125 [Deltaproteobacteria bacterium]
MNYSARRSHLLRALSWAWRWGSWLPIGAMYLYFTYSVAWITAPGRYWGRVDLYVIVIESMVPAVLFVVGVAMAERGPWPRMMALVWWLVVVGFYFGLWFPWARCEVGPRNTNCVGTLMERSLL